MCLNRSLDTSRQKLKLTVSSIAAQQIEILFLIKFSIATRQIELRGSAKINNAKKLITYSFETRNEIRLNRYLKDIISHLLGDFFGERNTLFMQLDFCNQVFSISPNPKKFHKVFFLKPQTPLTKKKSYCCISCTLRVLAAFLVCLWFCNQANSLVPTLKILLVFLCKAVTYQLQQSKGCCGVKSHAEIRAKELVTYQDPCKGLVTNYRFVHQKKEGYYKIKSNWVLKQRKKKVSTSTFNALYQLNMLH